MKTLTYKVEIYGLPPKIMDLHQKFGTLIYCENVETLWYFTVNTWKHCIIYKNMELYCKQRILYLLSKNHLYFTTNYENDGALVNFYYGKLSFLCKGYSKKAIYTRKQLLKIGYEYSYRGLLSNLFHLHFNV